MIDDLTVKDDISADVRRLLSSCTLKEINLEIFKIKIKYIPVYSNTIEDEKLILFNVRAYVQVYFNFKIENIPKTDRLEYC